MNQVCFKTQKSLLFQRYISMSQNMGLCQNLHAENLINKPVFNNNKDIIQGKNKRMGTRSHFFSKVAPSSVARLILLMKITINLLQITWEISLKWKAIAPKCKLEKIKQTKPAHTPRHFECTLRIHATFIKFTLLYNVCLSPLSIFLDHLVSCDKSSQTYITDNYSSPLNISSNKTTIRNRERSRQLFSFVQSIAALLFIPYCRPI